MDFLGGIKKKVNSVASDISKFADKGIKDLGSAAEDAQKKVNSVASDISKFADKGIKDLGSAAEDAKKKVLEVASDVSEAWENREKYFIDLKDWTTSIPDTIHEYVDNFSIEDFWNKIKDSALSAGQDVVFMALACYYEVVDKFVSKKDHQKDSK